jgi:alpha-beta hydrolase superfamily lysophospholipase
MIGRVPRPRTVTPQLPSEIGVHDGLAFSLWLPRAAPPAGVVILHGAGSSKENHHDFARAALATGFAAVAFDQRGHGDSKGPMDGRAVDDVVSMAALLRSRMGGGPAAGHGPDPGDADPGDADPGDADPGDADPGDADPPIALRGSSMGGYLALVSAAPARAAAVVAICPASGEGLRRGLVNGRFTFDADRPALEALLVDHDVQAAAGALEVPVLLLHAEGDEQVPVEHSRELAAVLRSPRSRLIALPGGHHRSIQHDAELQAVSLRFIEQSLEQS